MLVIVILKSMIISSTNRDILQSLQQKVAFWFATGGAGFCISQALGIAMMPEAGWGILEYTLSNIPLKGHRRWYTLEN